MKTKDFLIRNNIKQCIIEIPFFNRLNPKTYFEQARLYQQMIFLLEELNIEYIELKPSEIKEIFSGNGKIEKKDMRIYLKENYTELSNSLEKHKLTADKIAGLVDSIAIGLCFP